MLLDVVLIHKEDNNNIDLFKRSFQSLISFEGKNLCLGDLRFNYSIQKSDAQKSIRLKVATLEGKSTKREADNIEILKDVLSKGKHRREYHIVFIFDGASEYYCNKLSRFVSIFERKLRQFIYLNVLDTYGKNWVKETLTEEIQAEVNKKEENKNSHIENALEHFTFNNYIQYLFSKRSAIDPFCVIEEAINGIESGNTTNTEIMNILKKGVLVSLWDKLFCGFDIDFNEHDIDILRNIRNDIMHNKEISKAEFVDYKKLLRSSIKKIDKGIFNIEQKRYSPNANIVDVLSSLSTTMESMKRISKSISEAISPAMKEIQKMSQKLSGLMNASGVLKVSKDLDLMLKKSYADIAPASIKSISESIAELQSSFVLPHLEEYKILHTQLKDISSPALENLKHTNLGLSECLNSISYNSNKLLNSEILQNKDFISFEQVETDEERSQNTEDSSDVKYGGVEEK